MLTLEWPQLNPTFVRPLSPCSDLVIYPSTLRCLGVLMLDHVSIRVIDYDRSKKFYEAALAPLGYTLAMENSSGAGFRRGFIPSFWVKQGEPVHLSEAMPAHDLAGCGGAS